MQGRETVERIRSEFDDLLAWVQDLRPDALWEPRRWLGYFRLAPLLGYLVVPSATMWMFFGADDEAQVLARSYLFVLMTALLMTAALMWCAAISLTAVMLALGGADPRQIRREVVRTTLATCDRLGRTMQRIAVLVLLLSPVGYALPSSTDRLISGGRDAPAYLLECQVVIALVLFIPALAIRTADQLRSLFYRAPLLAREVGAALIPTGLMALLCLDDGPHLAITSQLILDWSTTKTGSDGTAPPPLVVGPLLAGGTVLTLILVTRLRALLRWLASGEVPAPGRSGTPDLAPALARPSPRPGPELSPAPGTASRSPRSSATGR